MAGKKNSFVMKWSIKNFPHLWEKGEKTIYSPEFYTENMEKTKWMLRLSSVHNEAMEEYVLFQLLRTHDDGPSIFNGQFELSFLARDESSLKQENFTREFPCGICDGDFKVELSEVLFYKKDEYLQEDILTVCCKMWSDCDSFTKKGRCFAQTIIGKAHLLFYGELKEFSSIVPNGKRVVLCTSEKPIRRLVTLVISLKNDGTVFVKTASIPKRGNLIFSKLYLINNAGKNVECGSNIRSKESPISFTKKSLISKNEYLSDDTLKFQYEQIFSPEIQSEQMQKIEYVLEDCENIPEIISDVNQMEISKHEDNLINASNNECTARPTTFRDDLVSFYSDSVFHDVRLRVDKETIPAHRDILRARSPVFRRIFAKDVMEKDSKCIKITDLSFDTLKRLILFLYTDTIEELELQSAKELYTASIKYDLASLKQRCFNYMKQNLQPSNVCEILVLADIQKDMELKLAVQEYILKCDREVFLSDQWKSFMESNGHLASQVMYLKFVNKMAGKKNSFVMKWSIKNFLHL